MVYEPIFTKKLVETSVLDLSKVRKEIDKLWVVWKDRVKNIDSNVELLAEYKKLLAGHPAIYIRISESIHNPFIPGHLKELFKNKNNEEGFKNFRNFTMMLVTVEYRGEKIE